MRGLRLIQHRAGGGVGGTPCVMFSGELKKSTGRHLTVNLVLESETKATEAKRAKKPSSRPGGALTFLLNCAHFLALVPLHGT